MQWKFLGALYNNEYNAFVSQRGGREIGMCLVLLSTTMQTLYMMLTFGLQGHIVFENFLQLEN